MSILDKAEGEGAKMLLDGRNPNVSSEFTHGNFVGPTILDNCTA